MAWISHVYLNQPYVLDMYFMCDFFIVMKTLLVPLSWGAEHNIHNLHYRSLLVLLFIAEHVLCWDCFGKQNCIKFFCFSVWAFWDRFAFSLMYCPFSLITSLQACGETTKPSGHLWASAAVACWCCWSKVQVSNESRVASVRHANTQHQQHIMSSNCSISRRYMLPWKYTMCVMCRAFVWRCHSCRLKPLATAHDTLNSRRTASDVLKMHQEWGSALHSPSSNEIPGCV